MCKIKVQRVGREESGREMTIIVGPRTLVVGTRGGKGVLKLTRIGPERDKIKKK
jgi:hypothetical protein